MSDFIKGFPNAASKEYCDKVITQFDYLQETRSAWGNTGKQEIFNRQEAEEGIPTTQKDDVAHYIKGTEVLSPNITPEFVEIIWNCYNLYQEKYGILSTLSRHNISPIIKIQKTEPSQGYHIWHCDSESVQHCRKIMVVILYLNTVEEGGETEFLYQRKRIPPVQGTLALFPSTWVYAHRGNPPLKENKYILTTWIELVE